MHRLVIGILGLLIVLAIGYIHLSCYLGRFRLKIHQKIGLSALFFLSSPLIIYIINLSADGKVLSNSITFLLVYSVVLIVHLIIAFPHIRNDISYVKEEYRSLLSSESRLFAAALFIVFFISIGLAISPMLQGMSYLGDILRHFLYSQQLLNGFPIPHFPYYKSFYWYYHYPFMTHASLAFICRLTGFSLSDSYVVMHLYQAFLLPCGIFILIYKVTDNKWLALLAVCLGTLYAGHDVAYHYDNYYFNLPSQRIMPFFLSRTLGLSLVPVSIFILYESYLNSNEKRLVILSGLALGIVGLCHPYAFFVLLLFLGNYVLYALFTRGPVFNLLFVAIIAFLVSLLFYFPALYQHFSMTRQVPDYLVSITQGTGLTGGYKGQYYLSFGMFLKHFGAVGFMAVVSIFLLRRSKFEGFFIVTFLTAAAPLLITYGKGIVETYFNIKTPFHPAQQNLGTYIYLLCTIMSIYLIYRLMEALNHAKRTDKNKIKKCIIAALMILTCFGIVQTSRYAFALSRVWSTGIKKENNLDDPRNLVNIVNKVAARDDVIAVPEEICGLFSFLSGHNVVYSDYRKSYTHLRKLANSVIFAPPELREKIADNAPVDFDELLGGILVKFGVTFVVAPEEEKERYGSIPCLKYYGAGKWFDGRNYTIFRVDSNVAVPGAVSASSLEGVDKFLSSTDSYSTVLGYYPLGEKRSISPNILRRNMEMNISGLAWGGGAVWISDRSKNVIYRIDGASGFVISSFSVPGMLPNGLAWDGGNLWSVDSKERSFYKIDPSTGKILKTVGTKAPNPTSLAWGDGHLWCVDSATGRIYKVDSLSGKIAASFPPMGLPYGIAWREGFLWLTLDGGKILRYDVKRPRDRAYFSYGPRYGFGRVDWAGGNLLVVIRGNNFLLEFSSISSLTE